MNNLTEAQRRLLTKMIGECWHEPKPMSVPQYWIGGNGCYCLPCKNCGQNYGWSHQCRTFTSGNDMLLVKEAIEKVGKWTHFASFARMWLREDEMYDEPIFFECQRFAKYVIDNLCLLAAEWGKQLPKDERWWKG